MIFLPNKLINEKIECVRSKFEIIKANTKNT